MFMHCLHMKTQENSRINIVQKHLFLFYLLGYFHFFRYWSCNVCSSTAASHLEQNLQSKFQQRKCLPHDGQKQLIHDSLLLLVPVF